MDTPKSYFVLQNSHMHAKDSLDTSPKQKFRKPCSEVPKLYPLLRLMGVTWK